MFQNDRTGIRVMKTVGVVILVLGIIGGVFLAIENGNSMGEINPWTREVQFNFVAFFVTLITSIISTILIVSGIMVFAAVADNVTYIARHVYDIEEQKRKAERDAKHSNSTATTSPATGTPVKKTVSVSTDGEYWICPKCQDRNPKNNGLCRGCGAYK